MSPVLQRLQGFVAAVRQAGVPASPDRVHALLVALAALGPQELYWAGRLTLCGSADDLARYDAAWRGLAGADGSSPHPPPRRPRLTAVMGDRDPAAAGTANQPERALATRASGDEVLRHRDLAQLTADERAEVRRLLAMLAPAAPQRPSRRRRRWPTGRVDADRTFRSTLRGLGEPARLGRHRRTQRPRRLVLLLDVSGSMAPYADALLRFGHAAVRAQPDRTEVFTIGTRLTRVTGPLRTRDADTAVGAAGRQVPDWRGGTRLGEALTTYLRAFGHRGMARRAVVVICSDGWECGDPAGLGEAVAWLARLAHRVVWVTPHAGRPGFAPTAAGLAAAHPHLHHLVAGHSLHALGELVEVIRRG